MKGFGSHREGHEMIGRVMSGLAALVGTIILVRSLPDLVRYFRVRRM
jgi:hypothetical protein